VVVKLRVRGKYLDESKIEQFKSWSDSKYVAADLDLHCSPIDNSYIPSCNFLVGKYNFKFCKFPFSHVCQTILSFPFCTRVSQSAQIRFRNNLPLRPLNNNNINLMLCSFPFFWPHYLLLCHTAFFNSQPNQILVWKGNKIVKLCLSVYWCMGTSFVNTVNKLIY
jgi:hypothetical protein